MIAVLKAAGARVVPAEDAEALVWVGEEEGLADVLTPAIRWVQLPSAGIEGYLGTGAMDDARIWTAVTGAYGRAVAEQALALMLAGLRRLHVFARSASWDPRPGRSLDGATIAVVGAGGIGRALIELLAPWDVRVLAVTRSGRAVEGAAVSLPAERLAEVWPAADVVVLCAPATSSTAHMVGEQQLRALREDAWLVNVARGALIDTDALVRALAEGWIAGAALDVTDPEPLPDGHPLWNEPRALISPHVANPPATAIRAYQQHLAENVRRFAAGEPLLGVVDLARGY